MTIRIDLPVDTGLDAAKAAFEDEDTLRQAIEAARLPKDVLVEISCIACR